MLFFGNDLLSGKYLTASNDEKLAIRTDDYVEDNDDSEQPSNDNFTSFIFCRHCNRKYLWISKQEWRGPAASGHQRNHFL